MEDYKSFLTKLLESLEVAGIRLEEAKSTITEASRLELANEYYGKLKRLVKMELRKAGQLPV